MLCASAEKKSERIRKKNTVKSPQILPQRRAELLLFLVETNPPMRVEIKRVAMDKGRRSLSGSPEEYAINALASIRDRAEISPMAKPKSELFIALVSFP